MVAIKTTQKLRDIRFEYFTCQNFRKLYLNHLKQVLQNVKNICFATAFQTQWKRFANRCRNEGKSQSDWLFKTTFAGVFITLQKTIQKK